MPRHTIQPIFDENSKILVLGSFPSVKSREAQFYYGHPQNRFWRVMAAVLECETPRTNDEKRAMLLRNNVALWDVIASCDLDGSSDSSIKNVVPNDIGMILGGARIERIFTNGGKAGELYRKYILPVSGIKAVGLPSTSPANARYGFDRLVEAWKVIKKQAENY